MATTSRYRFPQQAYVRRIENIAYDVESWANAYFTMQSEADPLLTKPSWADRAEDRERALLHVADRLHDIAMFLATMK